jgi:hypothetical protein
MKLAEVPDCGFEFEKCGQLLISTHNETFFVPLSDNDKDIPAL